MRDRKVGADTCNCRTVIAAEQIISGALDGAAPAKPTAPLSYPGKGLNE